MPPSKRSSTNTSAGTAPRAKRSRSSTAKSMAISDSVALPATVSIDVAALSATVSAVVTEAPKTTGSRGDVFVVRTSKPVENLFDGLF